MSDEFFEHKFDEQPPALSQQPLQRFVVDYQVPELKEPTLAQQKHYTTGCVEEKALVLFNEALQKQLSLSTEQVFDWPAYFTAPGDAKAPIEESELFSKYYQLPSFVIQYALVKIRIFCQAPKSYKFYQVILNSRARTQLQTLIEVVWDELDVNRGSKYMSVRALRGNIELMRNTLEWFQLNPTLKPDDNWTQVEHRVFPILPPSSNKVRGTEDDFRALVAQACFVDYEQAIEMDAPAECVLDQFEQKISLAARKAFSVLLERSGKHKSNETTNIHLLNKQILVHQTKKVLFAKLIANYFAEAQVLAATAAMNKPVAQIRQEETVHLLQTLATLLQARP